MIRVAIAARIIAVREGGKVMIDIPPSQKLQERYLQQKGRTSQNLHQCAPQKISA
jgi:hypothetical protein